MHYKWFRDFVDESREFTYEECVEAAPFQDEQLARWALVTCLRFSWIVFKGEDEPIEYSHTSDKMKVVLDKNGEPTVTYNPVTVKTKNRQSSVTDDSLSVDDVYVVTKHGIDSLLSMIDPFQDFMGGWEDLSSEEFLEKYYRTEREYDRNKNLKFCDLELGDAHQIVRKELMWGMYYHGIHQNDEMFPMILGDRRHQWQRILDLVSELEDYDYMVANDQEASRINLFKLWWRAVDECENMC